MSKKLSVALGLREKVEKDHKNMLDDMLDKFKKKQGLFQGFRFTFKALEGFPDQPEKRKFQLVSSTVQEQLDWFKENSQDYFNTVLSIEKTNAGGIKAHLVVGEEDWGEYTTLELLRLKSVLDSKLKVMIQDLPIRPASELWAKTADSIYGDRDVWETPLSSGFTKTTFKRTEIVNDPHIKESPGRPPVVQQIDSVVNTGEVSEQLFHGGITNRERAELEVKYNNILKGVIAALEEANSAEVVESDLGDKVLNYLFK